ncbi:MULTISPECIES: restriction endonuclease subunit S [unclassified Thioalkalivibrio]|uniref:restriction endonuclease subunit S n=1 Tax=unclassified Thioalkalivibrio TaxID=2621013 RepID=UPI0003A65EBF|nr:MULTISPECIES: restriction endonuclease subunit S [unclassified Thioalkalivibrio]
MSFPKYPEYKDSGVEWLGEVPAHWALSRVKYDSHVKARIGWHGLTSDEFTEVGPYLVTGSDFKGKSVCWSECYHCTEERYAQDPHIQLKEGDLLITKDGTIGKLILVEGLPGKATLNSGIFVVRPLKEKYSTRFYYWLLQSRVFKDYIGIHRTGSTILHLYQETFENLAYALPPVTEQTRIVAFLDNETGKIDTLIEEQRRLVELLKEKRQAVISHAVTKGLDPNVPMKDSGVDWLGEVPAHWEIRKLSTVTEKITNGYVGPTRDIFVSEGVPYLQSLHIKNNQIVFSPKYFVSEEWSRLHHKSILRAGDVLIVQTGDIGQVAVVTKEFTGSNCHALIVVSPVSEFLYGVWLSWVLNSDYGYNSLLSIKTGALHPHLNCGYVKDVYVPLPPLGEQYDLVGHIERELESFSGLISEAEKAKYLLQERRSALISAAVTGKIDVRGWSAGAETKEPELAMVAEESAGYSARGGAA